jgi:hypothetical protein
MADERKPMFTTVYGVYDFDEQCGGITHLTSIQRTALEELAEWRYMKSEQDRFKVAIFEFKGWLPEGGEIDAA